MFNPIEFLFQKRLTSVLGIDIGTSSIKIAELRREEAGKFRLVNYAIMEMHHLQEEGGFRGLSFDIPDAELAKYIKILIKEAGFNSETAVMSLPVFSTFVTIMRMPALNEKELAGAIPLQAREYIPIPISEVVLDWKLIRTTKKSDLIRAELAKRTGGDDASGGNEAAGASGADEASGKAPGAAIAARKAESEVLLMAAPRDMVQKYVRVAQMANLTLAGLEIESFSLTRSTLDPQDAAQPVLFLDIGSLSSSVAVFDDGFLRIVHNVGASSTDLMRACARALGTDIDRARAQYQAYGLYASGGDTEIVTAYLPLLEALSRDIERVFSAYWRSSTRQVSRVLLSGGAAVLKGLDHYLSSRLRVPVEIVNPLARLAMPKDLAPAASLIGPPLANAVGLAMKEI